MTAADVRANYDCPQCGGHLQPKNEDVYGCVRCGEIVRETLIDYPIVGLTNRDLTLAHQLAKAGRQAAAYQDELETDGTGPFVGFAGEIAVARYYDFSRPEIFSGASGDGGVDYTLAVNGEPVTVDVKTSTYPAGHLLVPAERPVHADRFLLVEKYNKLCGLIGWTSRKAVLDADVYDEGERNFRCRTRFIHRDELERVPRPESVAVPDDDEDDQLTPEDVRWWF